MSHVYFTSDWHIGHSGITEKFRTQFPSDDAHDEYILNRMSSTVTKRDVMYVIGDVTWTESGLRKIYDAQFPCKMIMVGGNHDTLPVRDYLRVFDEFYGAVKYKGFWLTHIPIHEQELYRGLNIHGHCHRGGPYELSGDGRYFNAILEFNDYRPVCLADVQKSFVERSGESD